jgi:hypothetical protein
MKAPIAQAGGEAASSPAVLLFCLWGLETVT